MNQFQVLGLLQRLVAVRRLVAIGDHVARQRGQHILRTDSLEIAAMRAKERRGPGI